MVLTLSRGGWVGVFTAMIFFTLNMKNKVKKKTLLFVAVLFGCFLMLSILSFTNVVEQIRSLEKGSGIPSLASRVAIWRATMEMVIEKPWWGWGPGTYAYVFTRFQPPGYSSRFYFAHNDYLQFIAEIGLGCVVFFAMFGWILLKNGFARMRSSNRFVSGLAIGVGSGIISALIHSTAEFNLHIPANALYFTVFVAILFVSPLKPASMYS
jgi:O-antigen ligase